VETAWIVFPTTRTLDGGERASDVPSKTRTFSKSTAEVAGVWAAIPLDVEIQSPAETTTSAPRVLAMRPRADA
jgi:hypothetical protein